MMQPVLLGREATDTDLEVEAEIDPGGKWYVDLTVASLPRSGTL